MYTNTLDNHRERYYYIEHDGKVYLDEQDGILVFPKDVTHLPFSIIEKRAMNFPDYEVVYCGVQLDTHPDHWHSKDELPGLENVHYVVRQSLHMSFPRCVAESVFLKDSKVLLVNASRGITKGCWNLPGGFMEYGESPEDCVLREVKEEIGLDAGIVRLINVYTKASAFHPYHLIAFAFLCEADRFDIKLDPDEISEANWFEIQEALTITKSHFTRLALEDLEL